MRSSFNQEKLNNQEIMRGLILTLLEAWGFNPCREDYLRKHVGLELPFPVTQSKFANELEYLSDKGLLTLERLPTGWLVRLTSEGLDVAQGKVTVIGIQFID